MRIQSTYKFAIVKNRKPFFGEVILEIEVLENAVVHQIIENYQGDGFKSQGYVETIPKEGYETWKTGIKNGILYGLSRINDERKFRVSILESSGLSTDTNPIILAYAASRAILEKIEHIELQNEKDKLEALVFSSWNYKFDSQLNFNRFEIV